MKSDIVKKHPKKQQPDKIGANMHVTGLFSTFFVFSPVKPPHIHGEEALLQCSIFKTHRSLKHN